MPPKTESQKSAARAHRARPKSKPKFELPAEKTETAAAAAWVHRSEEAVTPERVTAEPLHHKKTTPPPPQQRVHPQPAADSSPTLVKLGVVLFAAGFAVIGQVSLAAFSILATPVRWGRQLLPR